MTEPKKNNQTSKPQSSPNLKSSNSSNIQGKKTYFSNTTSQSINKNSFKPRYSGSRDESKSQVRSFGSKNTRGRASNNFGRQNSRFTGERKNRFGTKSKGGNRRFGDKKNQDRKARRQSKEVVSEFDTNIIEVKRVTRVTKGGKKMRFSALVVVGDKNGRAGFAIKKGNDFQDAVAKATRKAKKSLIQVHINQNHSLSFPVYHKYKSVELMLKPADSGTGLIAGGFVRNVLELVGVQNIYSKIVRSRNKFTGVRTVFEALKTHAI